MAIPTPNTRAPQAQAPRTLAEELLFVAVDFEHNAHMLASDSISQLPESQRTEAVLAALTLARSSLVQNAVLVDPTKVVEHSPRPDMKLLSVGVSVLRDAQGLVSALVYFGPKVHEAYTVREGLLEAVKVLTFVAKSLK